MPREERSYKKPVITSVLVGLAVLFALLLIVGAGDVIEVFSRFDLRYLPFILVLAPMNYLLRYIKWKYFLKQVGLQPDPAANRLIFMSGLGMTVTPAKVGELLKCYLLKEHMGAPISLTSPVVMAERLTDALAMVMLASIGALYFAHGLLVLIFTAGFLLLVVLFFHYDPLFKRFSGFMERKWLFKRGGRFLREFQHSSKTLFTVRSLLLTTFIGVLSWSFEGFVIFFTIKALGGSVSVLESFFVVSFSSIVGTLSFLPGGLGVAEGSIMGLLLLVGVGKDMAAATTVVTRFSTLWLGVGVGMLGLFLLRKKLLPPSSSATNVEKQ